MSELPAKSDILAPFDQVAFISNFEGLEVLAQDTIMKFDAKLPEMLSAIDAGIITKSFEKTEIAAHTLKGVVSIFYAEPSRQLAMELEELARSKSLTGAEQILIRLKVELERLQKSLHEIMRTIA